MIEQPITAERMNALRQKMKDNIGWTDAELDSLTSKHWAFISRMGKIRHYKMIAEVIQVNDHCELQPMIGDKYTFTGAGMLIPEETTFPGVCLFDGPLDFFDVVPVEGKRQIVDVAAPRVGGVPDEADQHLFAFRRAFPHDFPQSIPAEVDQGIVAPEKALGRVRAEVAE